MTRKKQTVAKDADPLGENKSGKGRLVGYFVVFICGFLAGIVFTVYKGGPLLSTPSTVATKQAEQQNDETAQAILNLEAEVTAHPDNYESWVRLGHLYYDSNQPEKAISAYSKSLQLHEGDANLLTDLGVMYRRAKQPEKAIEYFDKAIEKQPDHLASRFNKGIVQYYDLHDAKGAIASWEGILNIDPGAKAASGQPIRELVDKLKKEQTDGK